MKKYPIEYQTLSQATPLLIHHTIQHVNITTTCSFSNHTIKVEKSHIFIRYDNINSGIIYLSIFLFYFVYI